MNEILNEKELTIFIQKIVKEKLAEKHKKT